MLLFEAFSVAIKKVRKYEIESLGSASSVLLLTNDTLLYATVSQIPEINIIKLFSFYLIFQKYG